MRTKRALLLTSIDVGTNTLRLLIATVTPGDGIMPLYSENRIICLGEGISKGKLLTEQAMERTINGLKYFKSAIERYTVDGIRAVATSAVRDASNRREFLETVRREVKLDIDVLTGREEGRLTLLGVNWGIKKRPSYNLVMDIGGGSTEFILAEDIRPKSLISLNFGVVHLTESFIKGDPAEEKDLRRLRKAVREKIEEVMERTGPLPEGATFIGTGGTITTLAAIDQGLQRYSFQKINNYIMKRGSVEKIYLNLRGMTLEQKRKIPALQLGREDLILPDSLILLEVMKGFGFRDVLISDYGLREGVLIDLYRRISRN